MKYEEFIEKVKDEVSLRIGEEKSVDVYSILKNNGIRYEGLIIKESTLNISPTIYLNPFYDRYLDGASMEDIVEEIMKIYKENLPTKDFDISLFCDFEKISKNIVFKLVSKEANKELLIDVPYVEYQDLALVFVCVVNNFKREYSTILIHNAHINMWDVDMETLYQIALQNTPNIHPYKFDSLDYLVQKELPGAEDVNMYVLTNRIKIFGATCIVYPKMLKRIADFLEDNLIIIPSSVHETLIMTENEATKEYSLEELNEMVVETNETVLNSDEILSNHVYHFNRESEKITY